MTALLSVSPPHPSFFEKKFQKRPFLKLQLHDKQGHDVIRQNEVCSPAPLGMGPISVRKGPVSDHASNPQSGHACRMSCLHCDLSEILEETTPPDPELVDLIEKAFLEGQIDSQGAVAYSWVQANSVMCAG